VTYNIRLLNFIYSLDVQLLMSMQWQLAVCKKNFIFRHWICSDICHQYSDCFCLRMWFLWQFSASFC